MRHGLIFVLYEPEPEFVRNLDRAAAGGGDLVVVDNSPEPDAALHERLRGRGMQPIVNRNAGGLAGAYNRGAEALLARGCEVFFLLDQDSRIGDQLRARFPKATGLMDRAEHDVLAYIPFLREHRARLYSTNPLERLNGRDQTAYGSGRHLPPRGCDLPPGRRTAA